MNTERKRQFVSAPDAHTHHGSLANLPSTVARLRDTEKSRSYLVCDLQSQLFPQLHALLRSLFREVIVDNPRFRETVDRQLNSAETRRALDVTSARLEPALRRIFHLYWRFNRGMTLGVRAVVLDRDNRVFLVKHSYVAGWHLPGGGVEVAITDALRAKAEYLYFDLNGFNCDAACGGGPIAFNVRGSVVRGNLGVRPVPGAPRTAPGAPAPARRRRSHGGGYRARPLAADGAGLARPASCGNHRASGAERNRPRRQVRPELRSGQRAPAFRCRGYAVASAPMMPAVPAYFELIVD